MIRALGFIAVRMLELCLAFVYPLAPCTCVLAAVALDPLHEALRPPPAPDRTIDLRAFYSVTP